MTPKAAPKATAVAVLLALALCALAVVAGRDALIEFGALTGGTWIAPAIDTLMGTTAQGWMLPAGIAAAVVGLVLVLLTLLPRRKTHRPTESDGVWISRRPGRARISSIGAGASVFDRLATFLVGALLIAVGLAAAAWQRDQLPDPVHDARRTVETWSPTDWASNSWWPWALTGAAVLALLVGLRWLYAHRPRRGPARLVSESDEHASVDLVSAAGNAAAQFESAPGISSATGRVLQLKKNRVLRISGYTDGSDITHEELVESAAALRDDCARALDGLAVDVQVLVDLRPAR
ncbi:hypothetical protein [Rhodococcus sp. P1Y]|uniref:hypothetical protein n=1 Tax=Rhodococcus sp. P1Y TaxID=1302308 RepID=UPI000EAB65A2|nr:hypothetical protein [Rhodococcus sp. P1Y]AYJ47680.1 hypothetical protein D8W71_04275 [Rhodococcus sp. P1Y]